MALTQRDSSGLARRPEEGFVPLSQAMDRLFRESVLWPSWLGSGGIASATGTNLWETGDSYVVQVAMPGMRPDSIECTVEQNMLTVKAEPASLAPERATAIWQSFGDQAQYRIQLPAEVESGAAEASYRDGVLELRLPKAAHARSHTIKVAAK